MTDKSRDLIQRTVRAIEASQTTSATPPGQAEGAPHQPKSAEHPQPAASAEHVETINQVFALFRLNYHNQYYAAFSEAEQLKQIKKLWLDSLAHYPAAQILRGARYAIDHCEFLPTLKRMHECCQQSLQALGLPLAHDAYLEACNRASPKANQRWSHPAVYLAGHDSGWHFLANNSEARTWPVFERHYQNYCQRVVRGEHLYLPKETVLEQQPARPLPKEEQLVRLKKLREETGL
ncbi:MAG: replication protein P [Parahaliea sp.]